MLRKLHKDDIIIHSPEVGCVRFSETVPILNEPFQDDEGEWHYPSPIMWRCDCMDGVEILSVPFEPPKLEGEDKAEAIEMFIREAIDLFRNEQVGIL